MEQGGFVALPAGHQAALRVVHAKIALFDGEPEAALALLERHGEQCACEGIPMLDAAVLAVRIVANIMLRSDAEQITEDVCALEALEERLVPLGGQDYEAVALAAGRAYLGQAEDGVAFFSTYLEERRRDAYPFPDSLAGMLDTLLATAVS